jgi:predicted NUDIX family phosphoesterase
MKVTMEAVNSANVKVNNSVDATRVYEISANINVADKFMNNVSDGIVKQGEVLKANFQRWSTENLNIQFQTSDVMEMCSVINAINGFIADCEKAVENNEFNL